MSDFGNDPYARDAAYEGGDFFEVSDWKRMLPVDSYAITEFHIVVHVNPIAILTKYYSGHKKIVEDCYKRYICMLCVPA